MALGLAQKITVALLAVLLLGSCEQLEEWTQQGLESVGLADSKKPQNKTKKKSRKRAPRDKLRKKLTGPQSSKTPSPSLKGGKSTTSKSSDQDIIITRDEEDPTEIKSTTLKTAVAPKFKVEAPVHVKKRVGGVARFIQADDRFVYMDFPQHFAVYDQNLELLTVKSVAFPVVDVRKFVKDGKIYLYLKEENNVLEILELVQQDQQGQKVFSLIEVLSKDLEDDFAWIKANQVLSLKNKKLQFLDLSHPEKITIPKEAPISRVSDVHLIKNNLFLSRNDFLDILDLETLNISSSIRIGRPFLFFGHLNQKGKSYLVLGYLNDKEQLEGIQYLRLNGELTGINDFADNLIFETPLVGFHVDLKNQWLIGQEVDQDQLGPVRLYSLQHKRFLRGPLTTQTSLQAWSLNRSLLYLVDDKAISIHDIVLDEKVISQAAQLKQYNNNTGSTPLAQIGASKIVRDEYQLKNIKSLGFVSDSRKVVLLDKNHLAVFENSFNGKAHRIFTTTEFDSDDFILGEPKGSSETKYERVLTTNFGLFLYSKEAEKVYYMDPDLNLLQPLTLNVKELVSWIHFTTEQGEALVISHKSPSAKGSSYQVDFYLMHAPNNIQRKNSLKKSEPAFVFYVPEDQIILLSNDKMELYNWKKVTGLMKPKPEATENQDGKISHKKPLSKKKKPAPVASINQPEEVVTFYSHYDTNSENSEPAKPISYPIIDAKISPRMDTIYALTQEKDRLELFIFDIFELTRQARLKDFDITQSQFRGSSFSKDGRLFILPSNEGTLFYDVTKLNQIREVAHWPLLSHYVDVADRGQFICVALGYKGVYCGDLLF